MLSVSIALAQNFLDHEPSEREMVQGRDLTRYAKAGEFTLTLRDVKDVTPVRDFIWRQWREKQRGYLVLRQSGVDNLATSYIFIERAADGQWRVICRTVHRNAFIPPPPPILDELPEIISIQRVSPTSFDTYGGKYVLSFRGKDGKEVWRL